MLQPGIKEQSRPVWLVWLSPTDSAGCLRVLVVCGSRTSTLEYTQHNTLSRAPESIFSNSFHSCPFSATGQSIMQTRASDHIALLSSGLPVLLFCIDGMAGSVHPPLLLFFTIKKRWTFHYHGFSIFNHRLFKPHGHSSPAILDPATQRR